MALTQFAFMPLAETFAYPAGTTVESKVPSGTSSATTASSSASQQICRVATDTAIYVSFGTAPNATTDTVKLFLTAGATEYFRVGAGTKAAVVTA